MPKVKVPRKNVTPGEVVTVLSRRLGPGYQVESNGDHRVTVRKNSLMSAHISITEQPGASVFRVSGGGLLVLRIANTLSTARRVADALRRSPEFRSL
jgi:acetylornithine deacetylase/succinyl-diaminopimelate desuccinylase-like protein